MITLSNFTLGRIPSVNCTNDKIINLNTHMLHTQHELDMCLTDIDNLTSRIQELDVLNEVVLKYGLTDTLKSVYPDFEDLETVENVTEQLDLLSKDVLETLTDKLNDAYNRIQEGLTNSVSLQHSMVVRLTDRLAKIDKIYDPVWKDPEAKFDMFEFSVTKFFSNSEATLRQILSVLGLVSNNKYDSKNSTVLHVSSDDNKYWLRDITNQTEKSAKDLDTPKEIIKDAVALSKKVSKIVVVNKHLSRLFDKPVHLSKVDTTSRDNLIKTVVQCGKQITSINKITVKYLSLHVTLLNNLGLKPNKK